MDKRIKEYKIVLAQNVDEKEFNHLIRNEILDGWEIYGNHQLAVEWDKHNDTDSITITQAVVKYYQE
jgi:hypothetical protein